MRIVDDDILVELLRAYKENDYPLDRLVRNRDCLQAMADLTSSRVGKPVSPDDAADTLMYIRKDKKRTGGLPTLGRGFTGPNLTN